MKYPNIIELEVSGRRALFTDPLTKTGGEKCSYPIPTYEALKGMLSSVYWVPDIIWVIDAVRIMNPIRTESMTVPTLRYFKAGRELSVYTYLRDVSYRIRAHFIPRHEDGFLPADEHHHYIAAQRMAARGGRRDIFLGTRDCACSISCRSFDEGNGFYDDTATDFGLMFHGFTYSETADMPIAARYFRCRMENGSIFFPTPQECTVVHQLTQEKHHALV